MKKTKPRFMYAFLVIAALFETFMIVWLARNWKEQGSPKKRPPLSPYEVGTGGFYKREFSSRFRINIDQEFIHTSLKK